MNKKIVFIVCTILVRISLSAQNPLSQQVQTEFGIGISFPSLNKGSALLQAKNIRNSNLSYFQNQQGDRKQVGSYGNLIGWTLSTAYYLPVKKVKGLLVGSALKFSLTGTEPSSGGYEEGYFFNFVSLGLGAKYYPFVRNNLFVKGDFGLASVFTKNRYLDEKNQQAFFHQFGVGINTSFGLGYSFTPAKNKMKTLDLQAIVQQNNTRVEVNGIGNDPWRYSALSIIAAWNF